MQSVVHRFVANFLLFQNTEPIFNNASRYSCCKRRRRHVGHVRH